MSFFKSLNRKLPLPVVAVVLVAAISGASYTESKSLDKLEPKVPQKTSCIRCHTDRATLLKIADKANDPLYLVKTGDLTLKQLREYTSVNNKSVPWKDPNSKSGHPKY